MLRYEAPLQDPADVPEAWALFARPDQWSQWAPHLRGAWGLAGADGEVAPERSGAVRLLGALPVPVTITAKEPGVSWTWRVARAVTMEHRVDADAVRILITAPPPLEAALGVTYGPLVALLLRRLSRTATARRPPTRTGSPPG